MNQTEPCTNFIPNLKTDPSFVANNHQALLQWFDALHWQPQKFQTEAWEAVWAGKSGLVNAPTGSGKTYSLLLPFLNHAPEPGLRLIWITPIRALSKEIALAAERAIAGLQLNWRVAVRTGDTDAKTRQTQRKQMAELLITTPESLHLLLAQKGHQKILAGLQAVVVDEWHELLGSKRGVQMELALRYLQSFLPQMQVWGISATIGNLDTALEVLLGTGPYPTEKTFIKANIPKEIEVATVIPDAFETLPWAGHLGIKLLQEVLPLIAQSTSTLIFTNTRAQAEIWYQRLLDAAPELAGVMAMHHGSINRDIRAWVEDALHEGKLKVVVCTSSLDLGVDFRPVETIVQIGSPKGVARFLQRCGRSGHQPGGVSKIHFVPTHAIELIEAAALREAVQAGILEDREPLLRTFDVLIQFLITLAVADGFQPQILLGVVRQTYCFQTLTDEEWTWCLQFITTGGSSLQAYPDYQKVTIAESGNYVVESRKIAMRHRMSMGTIVSGALLSVRMQRGGYLGHIEEYFISKLEPGDVFWFAGQALEFLRIKDMQVLVQKSARKDGQVPAFMGGRMPLSAQLGQLLRKHFEWAANGQGTMPEHQAIAPLIALQLERSTVPDSATLLLETLSDKEGYHLFCYPFEGRFVHEGLAALLAYRLSLFQPISFSIAMNDYGFELLSDTPIPLQEALDSDVFTTKDLMEDLLQSVNKTEMARRKFRDIGAIAGLVFQGYPGQRIKDKNLQSSTGLLFNVFMEYEPDHLLLQQAHQEVMDAQLEYARLHKALCRINQQNIQVCDLSKPSPLAFPIMVDRLRERLTSEKLEDRIRKMLAI